MAKKMFEGALAFAIFLIGSVSYGEDRAAPATALEKEGLQQAEWRTDPSKTGISNCGGDIGTHAFVAATWVSGCAVTRVSARLNSFVDGRQLDAALLDGRRHHVKQPAEPRRTLLKQLVPKTLV